MKRASAIGDRVGDFIELRNAFARVVITRLDDGNWEVSGDTAARGRTVFAYIDDAHEYALVSLARYVAGRAD